MVKDDETEKVGAGGEIAVKDEGNHILISISGTIFALDVATIMAIGSAVLTTMVNPNSGFQIPRDNVYHAVADPESFSCIVHLARFGKLPEVQNVPMLLEQADYWGVKEAIENELSDSRIREKERVANAIKWSGWSFENAVSKAIEESKHHNYRRNDGHGRIYCRDCGNRDFDSRWYDESKFNSRWYDESDSDESKSFAPKKKKKYTSCKNCKSDIFYNPVDLGWCHKCGLCDKCQQRNGLCQNNFQMSMDCSRYSPIKSETNNEAPLEELSRLVINNLDKKWPL